VRECVRSQRNDHLQKDNPGPRNGCYQRNSHRHVNDHYQTSHSRHRKNVVVWSDLQSKNEDCDLDKEGLDRIVDHELVNADNRVSYWKTPQD